LYDWLITGRTFVGVTRLYLCITFAFRRLSDEIIEAVPRQFANGNIYRFEDIFSVSISIDTCDQEVTETVYTCIAKDMGPEVKDFQATKTLISCL